MRILVEAGRNFRGQLAVYGTAELAPWFTWNRYGSKTIGAAVRVGRRRLLSVVWTKP